MTTTTPPTFISFASPKGGVGKSTTCLAIAGALAAQGHKVHIVDFDQTETLWRWYTTNPAAQSIPGLTVEKGPSEDIGDYLNRLWYGRSGFVLVDLAGALTSLTIRLAAFAHLTITPAKLNEPDMLEANKLFQQLRELAAKMAKPIVHRILLNEVPAILPGHQLHTLSVIEASELTRFETLIHVRAGYAESFLTGLPPHFSDQSRPAVRKAAEEIDLLMREIHQVLAEPIERKAAA